MFLINHSFNLLECTTASGIETDTNGFIYNGQSPVGMFSLSDACRTGSMEAIEDIKSLGIKTVMLTGDSQAAARSAQNQVLFYHPLLVTLLLNHRNDLPHELTLNQRLIFYL